MANIDLETLKASIEKGEIKTVVCAVPDIWGRLVGKRLRGKSFLETALGEEGLHGCLYIFCVNMDMWPQPGYELTSWEKGYNDCIFAPDLSTLRVIPWLNRTAMVICDALDEETREPIPMAPRNILKRQLAAMKQKGYSAKFASELEFFLFQNTYEEAWEKRYRELTPAARYSADYHILQTTKLEPIVEQIREEMTAADIEIEYSKGEGGLGQQEINLKYAEALEMADRHVLYKNGVKEIAHQHGLSASFMAKITKEDLGSSCHLHTSLWDVDGKKSLCWDEKRPGHMSEPFGHFVGGLLAAARELTWMYAPNVNSYKRFESDSFAPVRIALGHDNRTCGFRLCGEHASFRVENRLPGADVNPYLAFSAALASGLSGIENKTPAPEVYHGNAYADDSLPMVPLTLYEAAEAFAGNALAKTALGQKTFDHLVNFARVEQKAFDTEVVTDWELMRYFERV
ncbi:MAG: glutamine synthetase family protein [Alphaproteobacteria bacterium]|nr:glutamine synthetase family protein [Pseudomonadota bacterium]